MVSQHRHKLAVKRKQQQQQRNTVYEKRLIESQQTPKSQNLYYGEMSVLIGVAEQLSLLLHENNISQPCGFSLHFRKKGGKNCLNGGVFFHLPPVASSGF